MSFLTKFAILFIFFIYIFIRIRSGHMSDNKSNNHELHIISRYLGILTSKYIVFLLLVLTLYPMNVIPGYILLAGIVFPAALKFAIYDNSADSKNDDNNIKDFTLYPTAKKYKFTYTKYRCESYNFILIMILLLIWQFTLDKSGIFSYPKNIVPSLILIIYILSRFLG